MSNDKNKNNFRLEEAAVSSREAVAQRMALFTFRGDGGTHAMLVDFPKAAALLQAELARLGKSYADGLKHGGPLHEEDIVSDAEAAIIKSVEAAVVGYIKFSRMPSAGSVSSEDRKNAFMIHLASAESGYGPLMYDLALSLAYPNYIMADRQSVSPGAYAVWQYYLQNRAADVSRVPLQGVRTGRTDMPESKPSKAAKEAWELSLLNMQIRDKKGSIRAAEQYGHLEPEEERRLQKDLASLLKKKERQEQRMESLLQGDPLAWKFKIKRPLGTARLSANAQKLREGLEAVLAEWMMTVGGVDSGRTRGMVRKVVGNVLKGSGGGLEVLIDIGDTFFQKKYRP